MIDQKRLDILLEELYAAAPDLRAQDSSLRALVRELLASKPDAPIDERFIARLRAEWLARAASTPSKFNLMNIFSAKQRFLVPGFAVLALAVAGVAAFQNMKQPGRLVVPPHVAFVPSLERVSANAFGKLSASAPVMSPSAASAGTEARMLSASPRPQSGGGMGIAVDSKMIPPDWVPTIYRYSYAGEPMENLPDQVDVYRRVKALSAGDPASSLQSVNLGLIDLYNVKDPMVQSFTLAEDRDQGYVFNVDKQEGMINIFQNGKWASPISRCVDQECYEKYRLKEADLLSDEETIRIADAFLAEYGIPKGGYADPIISNQWRAQYAAMDSATRSSFWFPEGVSVIYPFLVDGKIAHDENGSPYGLNVTVDVRMKRVQSVWNLSTRTYQVSSYAAETDVKRLLSIVENTDNYGGEWPENTKKVEVELGTPKIVLVRSWQQTGERSAEILVPALVFPVKNAPEGLWRQNVVVPLAKDVLDAAQPVLGIAAPLEASIKATSPEVK